MAPLAVDLPETYSSPPDCLFLHRPIARDELLHTNRRRAEGSLQILAIGAGEYRIILILTAGCQLA